MLSSCVPTYASNHVNSTVIIHTKLQKGKKSGWGTCSGVYVGKNEILTASHCVGAYEPEGVELKQLWVKNEDGRSAKAEIIRISPERDLCLLHTDLIGIPVCLGKPVHQGQEITIIGNPLNISFVLTKGIVSKINFYLGDSNPTKHFIVDGVTLPGNSGGPVMSHGSLVGILVRSTSVFGTFGASGLGIAVDIREIRGFLGSN